MTGRFVIYKNTNLLECGNVTEIIAIIEDEEEAYERLDEEIEIEKDLGNNNATFEIEYEYI